MATPRKRWFKVADGVLREEWDNDTLATVIRLMAWLNQRRARDGESSAEAVIGAHDAMAITGSRRPHVALQRLSSLPLEAGLTSASASLEAGCGAGRVRFKWAKYSEFQEASARTEGKVREAPCPQVAPSYLQSPSPSPSIKKREEKRAARTDAPDDLSIEQWGRLEAWAFEKEPWAIQHLGDLVSNCLGHFRASGKPMVDWYETCRNWIRRQRTDFGGVTNGTAKRRHNGLADATRNILAEIDERERRAQGARTPLLEAVRHLPPGGRRD